MADAPGHAGHLNRGIVWVDGQTVVFPERDNRGKVYLYFCPDDTTVALGDVHGIGTYGVPDMLPDGGQP